MTTHIPLVQVAGQVRELPAGTQVPVSALASGTPDGTKFVRDDGTLVTPTLNGWALADVLYYAAMQG